MMVCHVYDPFGCERQQWPLCRPLSLQQQSVRQSQAHTVPDLSAETFDGLHRKIAALERSKVCNTATRLYKNLC